MGHRLGSRGRISSPGAASDDGRLVAVLEIASADDGYRRALTICEELADPSGMAGSLVMTGALLTETDRVREAVDYTEGTGTT